MHLCPKRRGSEHLPVAGSFIIRSLGTRGQLSAQGPAHPAACGAPKGTQGSSLAWKLWVLCPESRAYPVDEMLPQPGALLCQNGSQFKWV